MATLEQQTERNLPARMGPGRYFNGWCRCCLAFLVSWLLFAGFVSLAADPYAVLLEEQFAPEPQADNPVPPSENAASNLNISQLENALITKGQSMSRRRQVSPPSVTSRTDISLASAVLLAAAILIPNLATFLRPRLNAWFPVPAKSADSSVNVLADEPSLAEFFAMLRAGPDLPLAGHTAQNLGSTGSDRPEYLEQGAAQLQGYFESTPGRIMALRKLVSELTRARDDAVRRNTLLELSRESGVLKNSARITELVPVWQIATVLEALLKQLWSKVSNVTPSALRTVAGALDLIEALSVRTLNPNLATKPPIRLLAVDDDPISRRAISFALKRAFNEPDLAAGAEIALRLSTAQKYDAIFLDVEMPGMDGFELCSKIHETSLNRTTPVIFVTSHNDFGSRAKSTFLGGQDLIAKPYLALEITVKALTLVLRTRLEKDAQDASLKTIPSSPPSQPLPAVPPSTRLDGPVSPPAKVEVPRHSSPVRSSRKEFIAAFFASAPTFIEQMQKRSEALKESSQPDDLRKFLSNLYVNIQSLIEEPEHAELPAVFKVASALEGMLKKLLQQPKLCTPSTLNSAADALLLLDELCRTCHSRDPAASLIRLLVVDDDPVARRAICASLQLTFGRPAQADSGEAAFALAAERPFDLIFLDVMMPGIDGFTTCSKIHQTTPNHNTPVIFVSSHDDVDSRSTATAAGGCAFITKPVLASQIMLIALTFIIRARISSQTTKFRNCSVTLPRQYEAACA